MQYEIRQRLICPPELKQDPTTIKKLQEKSFGTFLKEAGLVPPDMMGKEYDEEEIIREEMEARKDHLSEKLDHKEDTSNFEVSLVDIDNKAITIDCVVKNGEITFGKVRIFTADGIKEA